MQMLVAGVVSSVDVGVGLGVGAGACVGEVPRITFWPEMLQFATWLPRTHQP